MPLHANDATALLDAKYGLHPDPFLPGLDRGVAHGVANGTAAIIGECNDGLIGEAFYWTPANGMQRLTDVLVEKYHLTQVSGWQLYAAYAMSADGKVIAGDGLTPDGRRVSWVAKLD